MEYDIEFQFNSIPWKYNDTIFFSFIQKIKNYIEFDLDVKSSFIETWNMDELSLTRLATTHVLP